jgi:hypothetical protein
MPSVEALVTARIAALPAGERTALFRAVQAAEAAVGLFHRHRAGGAAVPHPIALTPFLVSRRVLPALARLADCVHRLQVHAPALYREDVGDVRTLCPLPPATEAWLHARPGREAAGTLMIRPDIGLDAAGGARPRAVLFETNATGLAGLYNHSAGVAILRREVLPRVLTPSERARLGRPPDLLALAHRWVARAGRRLLGRRPVGIALVEEAGPLAGYSELPRLAHAFAARGTRAALGAPDQLRVRGGSVYLGDTPVDLVYRDTGFDELGEPGRGARLAGFRTLFARGAVLPGVAGEFGHKALLEVLAGAVARRLYSATERRLLAAVVPWTRMLSARFTADPRGRRIDLPEYARRRRVGLLIKPNVGSSGDGVLLGRDVTPARWEARIARALREPGRWVVQERRPAAPRPMTYLRDGRAVAGPCHSSLGLFYAPGDLGLHCRVSREPVVNVARGGALACAFLAD